MKKILLFLAKLILFSVLLVPLLRWFDLGCRFLLVLVTSGGTPTTDAMKYAPYVSSVKLYPFFALILATPALTVQKRLFGISMAILLYLCMDLLMVLIFKGMPFLQVPSPTLPHILATNGWDMLGHWLLPFLLWFMFAHRQITEFARAGTATVATSGSP